MNTIPPFEIYNANGQAPVLIVSDHGGRCVPESLADLGLAAEYFDRHIAYDIGAQAITRCLADRLNARAVLGVYSRLVVDLNRHPEAPDCIPAVSDRIPIPANQGLSAQHRAQRIKAFHTPYHDAIKTQCAALQQHHGHPPVLFSIHSFTPSLNGKDRVWDMGVLWNKDPRLPLALMEHLNRWDGLQVGDNAPYSGRDLAHTIDTHGTDAGIANCAVEIRQDHCATPEDARHWADILADALGPILTLDSLYTIQHY